MDLSTCCFPVRAAGGLILRGHNDDNLRMSKLLMLLGSIIYLNAFVRDLHKFNVLLVSLITQAGKLFQRFFFSIPSPQVDSFECISAIQRHPQNFHHYILATDQSLMLLDDRYLQHPVLKWRHHNEDPVQFIDVVCDAILQCDDTVLVISGSNHQQTHCFQMSSGSHVSTDKPSACTTQQCNIPPQSTSLPWKVNGKLKSYDNFDK